MTTATGMPWAESALTDRKSTRLNSSHQLISYAVFCLKKHRQRPGAGPQPLIRGRGAASATAAARARALVVGAGVVAHARARLGRAHVLSVFFKEPGPPRHPPPLPRPRALG